MKYDNTAKFTFDYTWRDSDDNLVSRTRHTTTDETLGEVLNAFELFLRGAGVLQKHYTKKNVPFFMLNF